MCWSSLNILGKISRTLEKAEKFLKNFVNSGVRAHRYFYAEVEAEPVPEAMRSQAAGHTNGLLLLHPAPSGFAVLLLGCTSLRCLLCFLAQP